MRFLFRLMAFMTLAIAVIAAVIDASRSLSAGSLVLTSLVSGWTTVAPSSLAAVQAFVQSRLPVFAFDPVFAFVLSMPAATVFAVLAAVFYALGAKVERPFGEIRPR